MPITLQCTLQCPHCGHFERSTMPTTFCQFFYECTSCHELLNAKEGDCCVFCSYGDVPCPSTQDSNRRPHAAMAVLHITYKHDPQTSQADYDGFYKVITSYRCRRLSESHWTINTEEPPEAVWQKLKPYIDPNDYFLMLPLDPSSFSPKDQTVLSWLTARP
jgi:hypothetical protein